MSRTEGISYRMPYNTAYDIEEYEERCLEEEMNSTTEINPPKYSKYSKYIGIFDECIENKVKKAEEITNTQVDLFDEASKGTEEIAQLNDDQFEETEEIQEAEEFEEDDEEQDDEFEDPDVIIEESNDDVSELLEEITFDEMEEETANELIAELEAEQEAQYLSEVVTHDKSEVSDNIKTAKLTISFDEKLVKKIKILAILKDSTIKELIESSVRDLIGDAKDEFALLME